MEKMLIQKKIKLDKINNQDLSILIGYLEKILVQHQISLQNSSNAQEDEKNGQLRRIIIKSILVSLNFVYTKKYLKNIISSFSNKQGGENNEIFGGIQNVPKTEQCVMEEISTLKMFKDLLFRVFREAQTHSQKQSQAEGKDGKKGDKNVVAQIVADQNQGFTTYFDFRDINEEVIYLFCSYAMSFQNSTDRENVDVLCKYVLPIGQNILGHCIYSLQKSQQADIDIAGFKQLINKSKYGDTPSNNNSAI